MKVRFLRDKDGKVDKNYVIVENGSYIRDKETGEKLIPYVDSKGYRVISITIKGKKYNQIGIRHLQWLAWKGIIPKGFHIHHEDENKKNDHKDNLDCLSNSEHQKHHNNVGKYMFGRTGERAPMFGVHRFGKDAPNYGKHRTEEWKKNHFGEKHPSAKLTDLQVEEIKILRYIHHLKQKDIAKKIGTTKSNVNNILQGYNRNPDHLSKEDLISQTWKRYLCGEARPKNMDPEGYW